MLPEKTTHAMRTHMCWFPTPVDALISVMKVHYRDKRGGKQNWIFHGPMTTIGPRKKIRWAALPLNSFPGPNPPFTLPPHHSTPYTSPPHSFSYSSGYPWSVFMWIQLLTISGGGAPRAFWYVTFVTGEKHVTLLELMVWQRNLGIGFGCNSPNLCFPPPRQTACAAS